MADRGPGHPIEEDSRRRGEEESHNPIAESTREAPFLEEVENIVPSHIIKSPANVELEKKCQSLVLMKPCGEIFDIEEVIVNASPLDKRALSI
jgi:hypothetical protein